MHHMLQKEISRFFVNEPDRVIAQILSMRTLCLFLWMFLDYQVCFCRNWYWEPTFLYLKALQGHLQQGCKHTQKSLQSENLIIQFHQSVDRVIDFEITTAM